MASQEQETAMYDQPALFESPLDFPERGADTVAAELTGMRIAPKGKSLRDIGRNIETRAQDSMRREMTEAKRLEAELLNKQIPEAAKAIIDEYSLRLDRATWVIVQEMVESGIRAGLALRTLR